MSWLKFSDAEGNFSLYDLDTGETLPVKKVGTDRVDFQFVYPDGKSVCVCRWPGYNLRDYLARNLRPRFCRISLETGEEQVLLSNWDIGENQLSALIYLGEDSYFVLLSPPGDGENVMYLCREDGTDKREIWRSAAYPYGFALSPDRKRMAYHTAHFDPVHNPRGVYAINVMDIDGVNQQLLASEEGHLFFGPVWSPDGKLLAFHDCTPETDPGHLRSDVCVCPPDKLRQYPGSDIAVLPTDNAPIRRLTTGKEQYFATSFGLREYRCGGSNWLAFTKDGKILHSRMSPGAHPDCYFDASQLDHEELIYDPASGKGGCNFCLLDPSTGAYIDLTPPEDGRWDFRAALSPDGKMLCYTSCRFGCASEVRVRDLETGEDRFVSRGKNDHGADFGTFLPITREGALKIASL